MGPELGEEDVKFDSWIYILFIRIFLFRLARYLLSPFLIFIRFLFGNKNDLILIQYILPRASMILKNISLKMLVWFKWLVWIHTFTGLILFQVFFSNLFAMQLSIFGFFLIAINESTPRSQKQVKCQNLRYDSPIDCRFMVLSQIMIRADLAYIYCAMVKRAHSCYESWCYASSYMFNPLNNLVQKLMQSSPPRGIMSYTFGLCGIFLVFGFMGLYLYC